MKGLWILCLALALSACSDSKDAERINFLLAKGVKLERENIVAWFPKDSLSNDEMESIMDTVLIGVRAANKLIGSHEWRLYEGKPINFYFSDAKDFRVAYASEVGDILIPFFRVRTHRNPWLHETLHILLRSNKGNWNKANIANTYFNMPQWLIEGLPEYMAMKISYDSNLFKADLFESGGLSTVDSVCNVQSKLEKGPYILEHIGESGVMRELVGADRGKYSPIFYNCSCSFTKYLAETYGLDDLILAIGAFGDEQSTIEEKTGKSMEVLKKEWLGKLR